MGLVLVSFSGLDGAGKSTQIEKLVSALRRENKRVKLVVMYDDISVARWIRSRFGSKRSKVHRPLVRTEKAEFRMDKNYHSPSRFVGRMLVYVLDALRLRWVWLRSVVSGKWEVLVFDRYVYDSLVNLLAFNSGRMLLLYCKLVSAIAPRVNVPVFLSAPPEVCFERKREYPLDYLRRRHEAYRIFFSSVVSGVEVDGSVEEVFSKVKEKVDESFNR